MKKNFKFFFFLSLLYNNSSGQPGLTINAGTPFFITTGTAVSMDGLVLQATSAFTINAPNTLQRGTVIVHTEPETYISRVYQWSNTTSPYSGTISVYYQDAELNSIGEAALTVNIHNGTDWAPFAAGTVRDASNNFVTATVSNVTLNELTLAALADPLPLTWGPVKAYRKNETALIEWITYSEYNTSHFEIERSIEGMGWEKIGNIPAANTPQEHHYILEDITAPSSNTLYRIKQVDQDIHYSYSPVVKINAINNKPGIFIYPNPVTDNVSVKLKGNSSSIQFASLYTAEGRLIKTEKKDTNIYQFNTAGLPSGAYWIKLLFANGTSFSYSILKK